MLFVGSRVLQKEHQIQKLKHTHNGVPSSIRDGTSCMAEQSSCEKRTFLALVQPPSEPIFGPKLIETPVPAATSIRGRALYESSVIEMCPSQ